MKSDKKNNVIDVLADDIWRCGELIRLKENSLAFRVATYMPLTRNRVLQNLQELTMAIHIAATGCRPKDKEVE